jgi:hypothetical protein
MSKHQMRPLLVTGRENDVEHHGEKEIENEDGERRVYDRFRGGATHPDRSFTTR